MSNPTDNLILLAAEGFKYLRRVGKGPFTGQYVGLPGKSGSTHKLRSISPSPRYIKKDVPRGVVRICYEDPKNFVEFPDTVEGRANADARLRGMKAIAVGSVPTSAVAVPRGRSYKNFVAERAKAAEDGSLYIKTKTKDAMSKKAAPKPPAKKGAHRNADHKNGISRPKDGTTTGKVWDIADTCKGVRADVIKEASKRKINIATITTQLGKWRKYNGIEGRTAPKKKAAPKPPAKKKSAPKPPAEAAPTA